MEPFDLITLQLLLPPTTVSLPGMAPTNPSSLTLALIGVGTLMFLGLGRRSLARRSLARSMKRSTAAQSTERRAA